MSNGCHSWAGSTQFFLFLAVLTCLLFVFPGYIFAGQSEEQKIFTKTEYFGDYSNASKKVVTGEILLVVWEPYAQNLQSAGLQSALPRIRSLAVDYDEIWENKCTDLLTKEEIKKWWKDLDISRLYWKNGQIQATTVLKKFNGNPFTNEQLKSPEYHITNLHSRGEALEKVR